MAEFEQRGDRTAWAFVASQLEKMEPGGGAHYDLNAENLIVTPAPIPTAESLRVHFNTVRHSTGSEKYASIDSRAQLLIDNLEEQLHTPPRIEIAPGYRLHGFLSTLFPKSFTEKFLDELLGDGEVLYQERLAARDYAGAARVKWAMRFWMLKACFGGTITAVIALFTGGHRRSE